MVRKNLWDRHEQAVLLVALQEVLYNNCDREKMIVDISRQLRQRAIANGDKIDDKFRNETGIRLQMLSLEHIFTNGKSGINKPNKWNSEIIHIYRDDWPYFQYVLHDGTTPLVEPCPRCGGTHTAPIHQETKEQGKNKKSSVSMPALQGPRYHCYDCHYDFGSAPVDPATGKAYADMVTEMTYTIETNDEDTSQTYTFRKAPAHIATQPGTTLAEANATTIPLTPAQWQTLTHTLYSKVRLHEWNQTTLGSPGQNDVTWALKIMQNKGKYVVYRGTNAFPSLWKDLMQVLMPWMRMKKDEPGEKLVAEGERK
ncbi:hypothetical protein [Megasphaera hominis]|uniref:Uncharacterized protein n=1 Tax=Megasphaera hominis TaxID=159836 RepID=A0ABR6VL24_9FIRM|nr:hypothetical protein [Megasphaera hominis]MBC3537991.1 hypothetical protein [Megasphaera hominis]